MKHANKIGLFLIIVCCFNGILFSQTKSLEQVRSAINDSSRPELFSAIYEKDLTTIKLSFDLREDNIGLQKPFKEFVFELTSIYAGPAVDGKPVRSRICINTRAKKFYFSSNRELTLFVDSSPLKFASGERTTELQKGKTRENLCWEMDKETMEDLIKSEVVVLQVGFEKVSIPAGKSRLFADYASLVDTTVK